MINRIAFILMVSFLYQDVTQCLSLREVCIPKFVMKGTTAQLKCLYDLDGEALYSVKWYKDGNEFYRYVPRDMPPAQTFSLPGVSVDIHNSSDAVVTLQNVGLNSGGHFRCEVSGEAPTFHTVNKNGDMVVVSLPDQGPPKITGNNLRYRLGEWVNVNCSAGRSKPAVHLTWYIDNEPAQVKQIIKYPNEIFGYESLERSILGLRFQIESKHFHYGELKLNIKCVATLSDFYWRSNEQSIQGEYPHVPEYREEYYASNSRADAVQANKANPLYGARLVLTLFLFFQTTGLPI